MAIFWLGDVLGRHRGLSMPATPRRSPLVLSRHLDVGSATPILWSALKRADQLSPEESTTVTWVHRRRVSVGLRRTA
jgi:hypothetical protein